MLLSIIVCIVLFEKIQVYVHKVESVDYLLVSGEPLLPLLLDNRRLEYKEIKISH